MHIITSGAFYDGWIAIIDTRVNGEKDPVLFYLMI
jgi:hypothetical protein